MDFLMNSQKGRLANILDNLGQVIVASLVFPFFESKVAISLIGIVIALIAWGLALHIERL